ncbi:MAG: hypothetical protein KAS49_00265 [Candidatus Cloacimonetes bacterium]|nr:hypothetical protein [Candidatus Cloacimonadota bacterium]
MFNKDQIVAKVLKAIANHFVQDYGTLSNFKIDSNAKSLSITLMLNGELNEVCIQLFHYEIIFEGEKSFLRFKSIHTSRQWLNMLYQNKFKGKDIKFEIPSNLVKPLKMFI